VRVATHPELPDMYLIEAGAQEPLMTVPVRLFDLQLPSAGVDDSEYEQLLVDAGLAEFRHRKTDSLVMGGQPGAERPDTAMRQGKPVAVIGRNDPCSCGSGKKFKSCCLQ